MKRLSCSIIVTVILIFIGVLQAGSGQTAETPQTPETVRILLARIQGELRISAPGGINVTDTDNRELFRSPVSDKFIFRRGTDGILLEKTQGTQETKDNPPSSAQGNNPEPTDIKLPASIVISPNHPDAPLAINERRYRGQLRVMVQDNMLKLINILEIEKYLYGVVPRELRTVFPEAARAQAVVARTYTYANMGRFDREGFDFSAGQQFQAYGGFDSEDPLSTDAVNHTRGLVLTFEGTLARYPLYHSTCGGSTTGNESVYLTNPVRYLQGTRCSHENPMPEIEDNWKQDGKSGKPEKKKEKKSGTSITETSPTPEEITKTPDPTDNLMDPNDDAFLKDSTANLCGRSPFYRWSVTWSYEDMLENVKGYKGTEGITEIRDITLIKRDSSSRIIEVAVETDQGELSEKGDRIRTFLSFKNEKGVRMPLYSTRFTLKKTGTGTQTSWTAAGSGWGHGLGMCQFGAVGLAEKGWSFREILKKYYSGAEIEPYTNLIPPVVQGSEGKE